MRLDFNYQMDEIVLPKFNFGEFPTHFALIIILVESHINYNENTWKKHPLYLMVGYVMKENVVACCSQFKKTREKIEAKPNFQGSLE